MKNTTRFTDANDHAGQNTLCKLSRRLLAATVLTVATAMIHADPTGGLVVSGAGSISQTGATTNITQTSQNLALNWATFNIAPLETVNFLQPSSTAIAVNRIADTNGTQILGQLNANGQVYLINPNGILFGPGAQVNVAGLVASTLDLDEASVNASRRTFRGDGTGSIVNQGTITATQAGYVALLGQQVRNEGIITARLGTVALGAGSAATLTFDGNSLVQLQVGESVLNSLAANGGLIRADGGLVLMTAGAQDALLASVVNNTGVIEARTVENRHGTIRLLGGMAAGTVQVGGTLDASAPKGGDGGFIETSAANVFVSDLARVTAQSTPGRNGTWLIDPADFTIAATGGNISGTTLGASLGAASVLIQSSTGTAGGSGDINVNQDVSWSANTLTLTAARDININAVMSASGTSALVLNTATANGADGAVAGGSVKVGLISGAFTGRVDFPGRAGPGFLTINGDAYTIVNTLGLSTTVTVTDLQGMKSGLATNYALGADIDASATSTWNAGAGFVPVGTPGTPYTGRFDGLGHTITALTINSGAASAGLFGATGPTQSFQNVGLVGGSVSGAAGSGGLIGTNGTGSTVSNSYNTGSVTGGAGTGGLVGDNTTGAISQSFATGTVTGASGTGGLVGTNTTGAVSTSYATGSVIGSGAGTGGLIGSDTTGAISQSFATGNVTGAGSATGGLVGSNGANTVSDTYATGNVSGGGSGAGGLLGSNDGAVTTSYSTGSVSGGGSNMGALVGLIGAGTVATSFWDSSTSIVQLGGGFGMTTPQMKAQADFTSATVPNGGANPNWNFATTWVMYEGITYPLLQPFMTPLTVTAANDAKVYNGLGYAGGNGVTYSTIPNANLLGSVVYSGTSQGAINVNSYTITPGGLYSNQQGYIINYANGALSVTQRPVSLTGTRPYDGTLNMAAGVLTIGTTANGETLTLAGAGMVASRNVGALKPLTLGTLALGDGTGLASNYTFTGGTQTADITQAPMTVTAQTDTKTYNASAASAVAPVITTGTLQTGDTTTTFAQTYDTPNAGTGKTITATGIVNDGNSGANYAYTFVANTAGVIDPKPVTISGTVADSRDYNGSTLATLSNIGSVTTGVGAETLILNSPLAANINFNTKNVVTANLVTGTGYTLANGGGGGLASNYVLTSTTSTAAANITPLSLTASVAAPNKAYDGNTAASPTLTVTSGLVNTETVTATGAATFNSKDVLTANLVTVNSTALADGTNGGLASNYSLGTGQTVAAFITPRTISLTGTRVYDRTTNVAAGTLTLSQLVGSETLRLTGTGTVADQNVGALKPLTLGTLALGDSTGLASNYTTNGGTYTATITPAPLTLTTVDVVKTYDGNLSALGTAVVAGGTLLTGDTISGGNFAYTDPSVGQGNKTVTTAAVVLSDGNSGGNYNVTYVNNHTSTIEALAIIVPVVPVVPIQILSFQESLRRNGLSLTPTITVSGSASPVLIVDAFALETGNGRAVNSTMGMGRDGPDLLLADASQSERYKVYSRTGKKPAVTKDTLIGNTP